jgi:hypothetical protein
MPTIPQHALSTRLQANLWPFDRIPTQAVSLRTAGSGCFEIPCAISGVGYAPIRTGRRLGAPSEVQRQPRFFESGLNLGTDPKVNWCISKRFGLGQRARFNATRGYVRC